ncbi:MFS transporter [Mumia sp.]|uniref:MFS transporter n=1 Tax=Mumia sp. TaxID=1965300 RepID=UPI00260E3C9E|nr:MFS transporter [Mumia sp.]MDD9350216.1 MFS transporter [Mumia sp.]
MSGPRDLPRSLLLLMALSTGLSVSANYLALPLLDLLADDLGIRDSTAGMIVTAAQVGYAVGLLAIVPLGDLLERRRLAVSLLGATAVLLVASSLAPGGRVLLVTTALTALTSVAAQVVVPFAVTLAEPEQRGRVVAVVMSGLLLGSIVSRPISGAVAQLAGWRSVYVVCGVLVAAVAVALRVRLPTLQTPSGLAYPALLGSTLALFGTQPVLRRRALVAALSLASFNTFWTASTFLLATSYGWSEAAIGAFGLMGIAGVVATPVAGRLVDAGRARTVARASTLALPIAWGLIALGGGGGAAGLTWLLLGVLALVVAQQMLLNANQNAIYALDPAMRNRLNAAFMTAFFVGGAAGSAATTAAWVAGGWAAVSALGAVLAASTCVVWLEGRRAPRDLDTGSAGAPPHSTNGAQRGPVPHAPRAAPPTSPCGISFAGIWPNRPLRKSSYASMPPDVTGRHERAVRQDAGGCSHKRPRPLMKRSRGLQETVSRRQTCAGRSMGRSPPA